MLVTVRLRDRRKARDVREQESCFGFP